MTHQTDIAAFIAEHPPRPGFSADQMAATWDHLSSIADGQDHSARRQLAAAVRWVQKYHGAETADAFVTYLSAASSGPDQSV
ncbi:hypothetical protein [Streptomyces cyslabdanicus]|uniref:hypothetical protein n=1 Tax=Streptomyces cyslabdanicus TaxID=1470456 RepID=UPI004043AC50